MEGQTFRTKLAALVQKSRKALRLYTTVGKGASSDLAELQVAQWKEINAELVKQLTQAMEHAHSSPGNSKKLMADVFSLRDRFYTSWRMAETDLHKKQKELLFCSENGDFIKASMLSRELVVLKARVQASQAVHHELHEVIKYSRTAAQPPIVLSEEVSLSQETMPESMEPPTLMAANVIPMRRRHR
jgi:hypothetical protein